MEDYNNNHPHESLGDKSPREFLSRSTEDFNEKPESFNQKLLNLELS
jgi:putative transposase